MSEGLLILTGTIGVFAIVSLLVAFALRRVVDPNEVHIVQSGRTTTSYGKIGESGEVVNGNSYYEIPAWVPIWGVTVTILPVSIIRLKLSDYEAYDKEKVSFMVDVVAFFRIEDTNLTARRAKNFEDLERQLYETMEGAVRAVLASHSVEKIMVDRSAFGKQFTEEINKDLKDGWGVVSVKNMELMDVRDGSKSSVISDIQAKKQSFIQMESRKEVAENNKTAEIAEIQTKRDADLEAEQARQAVFERTAEANKGIGVANEKAEQEIKEQAKVTAEKDMAVRQVELVRAADIAKEVEVVKAKEMAETTVIKADGDLQAKIKESEGIKVEGEAKAEAEKLMQLAPIEAQIELAKEIGENAGYQNYLVSIDAIKAGQIIGVEQAHALQDADIKVIANAGDAPDGVNKAMDLFTSKGGTNLAGMIEGLAQTPHGEAILAKFGVRPLHKVEPNKPVIPVAPVNTEPTENPDRPMAD